jgi:hypothetical protein
MTSESCNVIKVGLQLARFLVLKTLPLAGDKEWKDGE